MNLSINKGHTQPKQAQMYTAVDEEMNSLLSSVTKQNYLLSLPLFNYIMGVVTNKIRQEKEGGKMGRELDEQTGKPEFESPEAIVDRHSKKRHQESNVLSAKMLALPENPRNPQASQPCTCSGKEQILSHTKREAKA